MLHDFGKVVLEQHFQKEFHSVLLKAFQDQRALITVCRELLDIDHAEIGGMVASQWELPPTLKRSIEFHHNPSAADAEDYGVYIANLANYFCHVHQIGASVNPSPTEPHNESLKAI